MIRAGSDRGKTRGVADPAKMGDAARKIYDLALALTPEESGRANDHWISFGLA